MAKKKSSGRMGHLWQKITGVVAVVGVIITLLGYFEQLGRFGNKLAQFCRPNVSRELKIRFSATTPDTIFTALHVRYEKKPVEVTLQAAKNRRYSMRMRLLLTTQDDSLPGDEKRISIDGKKLQSFTLNLPSLKKIGDLQKYAPAKLNLQVFVDSLDGKVHRDTLLFQHQLLLMHRHFFDPANKALLNSFLTTRQSQLMPVVQMATKSVDNLTKEPSYLTFGKKITTAVAIYQWVKLQNIRLNPLLHGGRKDYRHRPIETLAAGAGTSDDLAILYCTLLKMAQIPALLFLEKSHLLVVFETDKNIGEQFQLFQSDTLNFANAVINRKRSNSHVWLPLDFSKYDPADFFYDLWVSASDFDLYGTPRVPPRNKQSAYVEEGVGWKTRQTKKSGELLAKASKKAIHNWLAKSENRLRNAGTADAFGVLAQMKILQNDLAAARRTLEKALALDADDGRNWFLKGNLERKVGRLQQARLAFERAIHLSPQDAAAYFELACVYILQGQQAKAQNIYNQGAEINRDLAERQYSECDPEQGWTIK